LPSTAWQHEEIVAEIAVSAEADELVFALTAVCARVARLANATGAFCDTAVHELADARGPADEPPQSFAVVALDGEALEVEISAETSRSELLVSAPTLARLCVCAPLNAVM
jgi:hypothetical protein